MHFVFFPLNIELHKMMLGPFSWVVPVNLESSNVKGVKISKFLRRAPSKGYIQMKGVKHLKMDILKLNETPE